MRTADSNGWWERLRAEERLVLQLLRDVGAGSVESGLDWDYVYTIAESHKLVSLVWYLLQRRYPALALPAPAREKFLARVALEELGDRAQTSLVRQLVQIESSLPGPVVFLKGSVLKWRVYPESTLRRSADVDVLVATAEVEPLRAALEALQFNMESPLWPTLEQQRRVFYELPPMRGSNGQKVDVHWNFTCPGSPYHRDPALYLQSVQTVEAAGARLHTLDSEYFLLHMAVHIYTSAKLSFTLRDLYDFHLVSGHGVVRPFDEERFLGIVHEMHLTDPAYFCCELTGNALDSPRMRAIATRLRSEAGPVARKHAQRAVANLHLLMRPYNHYMVMLEDVLAEGRPVAVLKALFGIRRGEYERLYFEPVSSSPAALLVYPKHVVRLLQFYHLGFGLHFERLVGARIWTDAKAALGARGGALRSGSRQRT